MIKILALVILVSSAPLAAEETNPTPCGLEEVGNPELKTCPPHITYDEEGEEVGG